MANEFRAAGCGTGRTVYVHLLSPSAQRWNAAEFVNFNSPDYSEYTIALSEQGASGVYVGNFPVTITTPGEYDYIVFIVDDAVGSPVEGDTVLNTGSVKWNGSHAVADLEDSDGPMSATEFLTYIKLDFKRQDKDTEILSALTDTIRELRRRPEMFSEDQVQRNTTAVISVLGQYTIVQEDDFGWELNDLVLLDGTSSTPLEKISKQEYNQRFPNPATSERRKPTAYCIFAGQIYLGGTPDSIDYTYRQDFTADDAGQVTLASSSIPYTLLDREMVKEGTLFRLYVGMDRPDIAQGHRDLFELFIAQKADKKTNNESAPRRVKYQGC